MARRCQQAHTLAYPANLGGAVYAAGIVLLLTCTGTGHAQLQTQPTEQVIDADTVRVTAVDSSSGVTPRGALWRSALVPGWGQLSQGHPHKAILFAGAGAGWLSAAIADAASVGQAATALDRQDRAARRNTRVLYYFITATLAGLDAYVDAHLDDFHLDADPFAMAGVRLRLSF